MQAASQRMWQGKTDIYHDVWLKETVISWQQSSCSM